MKKTRKIRTFEGLPVVDAKHSIYLEVKPIDVKNANKKSPNSCAAAKAGQRELNTDVRVFLTRTYVKQNNKWVRFMTPESASREIISFDRGASFEPGEYKFNPLPPTERLGAYRGKSNKKEVNSDRRIRKQHATGNVRERSMYDSTKRNNPKKSK